MSLFIYGEDVDRGRTGRGGVGNGCSSKYSFVSVVCAPSVWKSCLPIWLAWLALT